MLPTPHFDIAVPQPSASRDRGAPRRARGSSPLPAWRLKRTFAHIEANLSETVTLADLARAAGLTRMHFAAQFRAATGVRPHEFLLRRRIERAQELMQRSNDTLVAIALDVGFQTQAHFTTVFKRFVGVTPQRWRRANAAVA
jgi:AraC family transcriptional regulator